MNLLNFVKKFEKKIKNTKNITLNVGSRVRVGILIQEADKKRVQFFEGIIISKNLSSINSTFTVRRVLQGVGVEKTFPIYSPQIKSIAILHYSRVKRAKLFYLRDRVGKAALPTQNRGPTKFSPKLR